MRSPISRKRALRRLKPPPPTPEGMVVDWVHGGFAPMEWINYQSLACLAAFRQVTFRQMDTGNDYDLAARTRAKREKAKAHGLRTR